jgi:hypothetical protein
MVYQHIAWLDISMEDALGVSKVKPNQQLEHVGLDVLESQFRPQLSEVIVLDVFENEGRGLCARVGYLVE